MNPRLRVILDNDFGGDPDGLVQLAHHLLSPSVEIPLIISTKIPDAFATTDPGVIARGVAAAEHVIQLAGRADRPIAGSEIGLASGERPPLTEAAREIIREALRDDTDLPLIYAAGGGLTELATAYLHEPRIADRLTLVWIGGQGYEPEAGEAARPAEFNTTIDPVAAAIIFDSPIDIWQVSETTYEQCLTSWTELERSIAPLGPLARHLVDELRAFADRFSVMLGINLGETAVLGDSPLVVLTALRGPFRADASSSTSTRLPRRAIWPDGSYGDRLPDRTVRVFTSIDTRLMISDMLEKLRGV